MGIDRFNEGPSRSLTAAIKRAQQDHKPIFLATYDPRGDYNEQGLQIKYFTELDETKQLLKEHFIVVLLDSNHKDVRDLAAGINIERPTYFRLSESGTLISHGSMMKHPTDGLKIVKELIAGK